MRSSAAKVESGINFFHNFEVARIAGTEIPKSFFLQTGCCLDHEFCDVQELIQIVQRHGCTNVFVACFASLLKVNQAKIPTEANHDVTQQMSKFNPEVI